MYCDLRHAICDMWHATCDMRWMTQCWLDLSDPVNTHGHQKWVRLCKTRATRPSKKVIYEEFVLSLLRRYAYKITPRDMRLKHPKEQTDWILQWLRKCCCCWPQWKCTSLPCINHHKMRHREQLHPKKALEWSTRHVKRSWPLWKCPNCLRVCCILLN